MAIGHCKVTPYSIVYASVQVYSYLLGRFLCLVHILTSDAVMLLASLNHRQGSPGPMEAVGYSLQATGHFEDHPVQLSDSSQTEQSCFCCVESESSDREIVLSCCLIIVMYRSLSDFWSCFKTFGL